MARIMREKLMEVPTAALFKAITDFESYPKFLSEVVGAKIMPGGTKTKQRVEFELEVVKRFKYTLEFQMKGKEQVSWKLVDSNFFKTNEGMWQLSPKGDGQTDVHYELEVGFGFLVPGWISKKLTETNLPRMLDSFESQAKTLRKKD